MIAPLSFLVPNKLDVNGRHALFTFEVLGEEYGFYPPSIVFWIETLTVVALQAALSALLSIVTYKFIIQKRNTTLSYLIGFGWIIPFWLIVPRYELAALDVRNKIMKFCISTISPTISIFHTTEAMFGFEPPHVSRSISAYALYCGAPMELVYDVKSQKHVKSTRMNLMRHLYRFVVFLFATGMIHSYLEPSHFHPFGTADGEWYDIRRMFDVGQLANNFAYAVLFQMYLMTFCEGLLAATVIIFGYKGETVMENPVFQSTSPSVFWGKRWNKLIHNVLKRGVYLPVRKFCPKAVAVCATFLASGLFHEWLLTNVFLVMDGELDDDGSCSPPTCYEPIFFGCSAFFLWNALLIIGEYYVGGWAIFQWISQNVPKPVLSLLVVLLGLPVTHWFCESFVTSNFFDHGQLAFPMIISESEAAT